MKIIHLETAALEQVELKAIEDQSFMQVIEGDDALHGSLSSFISADNSFRVGLSTYTKASLTLTDWPTSEFMYFLEGQVEITDEGGESTVYGRGDAIVMPKGFNGTWRQLSPIKKIHVTYSAK